mgnify:CR=1 FL=1
MARATQFTDISVPTGEGVELERRWEEDFLVGVDRTAGEDLFCIFFRFPREGGVAGTALIEPLFLSHTSHPLYLRIINLSWF